MIFSVLGRDFLQEAGAGAYNRNYRKPEPLNLI